MPQRQRKNNGGRKLPFVPKKFLPVIVPVLLAIFYYGFIASDLYVVSASFVVRGPEQPKLDMLGMLTGIPGQAQSLEDSYILKDYLISRDVLDRLRKDMPLEQIFRRPGADAFSRLKDEPSLEELQQYWQRMVSVTIDKTTGLVTLTVRAFTPEDSMAVTRALLAAGEERLNAISARSRQDTLDIAHSELADSIKTLNEVRNRMAEFRMRHNMIDPEQTAQAQAGITEKLEAELVGKTAERANLLTYMQPSAPQVVTLTKRIGSLRQLLDAETAKNVKTLLSQDDPKTQPLIDEYNQLVIDREVAEKTYVASVQFLETSRVQALSQRRYVSVFSEPRLPEEATEPRRVRNIVIVFAFTFLLWGLWQLILATVREHRQWDL